MFTIIGGDGKEYGPVTAEQVRAWIAAGRANLETKAKALGSEEWRRLGDYSEFSGAPMPPPPPAADNTAAAPVSSTPQPAGNVDPKAFADALIARAKPLDVFGCYERAWELLKSDFWLIVGTTFVCWICLMVTSMITSIVPGLNIIAGVILGPVFYGGIYYFILKKIRGQHAELGDGFSGFTLAFGALALSGLVITLMVLLGCVLLILPGIYLAVAYTFTYMLAIDQRMSFWTAMEVSRRVITSQWWRIFGLLLLGVPVALAGLLALLIGIFVAMPLIFAATCYAYDDLCNPPRL
jgi:hypothetical protein